MDRRDALRFFTGGGIAAAARPIPAAAQAARRGLPALKITDVKVILTQPAADQLVIVKVLTSELPTASASCSRAQGVRQRRPGSNPAELACALEEAIIFRIA